MDGYDSCVSNTSNGAFSQELASIPSSWQEELYMGIAGLANTHNRELGCRLCSLLGQYHYASPKLLYNKSWGKGQDFPDNCWATRTCNFGSTFSSLCTPWAFRWRKRWISQWNKNEWISWQNRNKWIGRWSGNRWISQCSTIGWTSRWSRIRWVSQGSRIRWISW